jgi:hypothetical protein
MRMLTTLPMQRVAVVKFQEKAKDPKFDRYYSQNRAMLAADRAQVSVLLYGQHSFPGGRPLALLCLAAFNFGP